MAPEICKENNHCWKNMKNALSDHSDCDKCCYCDFPFIELHKNQEQSKPMPPISTDEKILEIIRYALMSRDSTTLFKVADVLIKRAEMENKLNEIINI